MSKQTEALKLAREALEYISSHYMSLPKIGCMALAAVEEALAEQPAQQEPEKDRGAVAEKHLAALKQSSKAITEEAAVNAVHKMAQARGLIDIGRIFTPEKEQPYPDNFIDALKYDVARRDSEALAEQPAQQQVVEHQPCKGMNCGITRTDQEHSLECQAEHAAAIAGGAFVKPEQEPVDLEAVYETIIRWDIGGGKRSRRELARRIVALYTTPPQRKPLTDEELRAIENKINPNMRWRSSDEEGITLYPIEYYELVRAIEAAHGIKGNT